MATLSERIVALRAEKLGFSAIAEHINAEFPDQTTTEYEVKKFYQRYATSQAVPKDTNKTVDSFRKFLGDTWKYTDRDIPDVDDTRRVIAVGDLHGNPDKEILDSIIDLQPDLVIVGGDALDSKQASPHKNELAANSKKLIEEVAIIRAWNERIIDDTDAFMWYVDGNHCNWLRNMVLDVLPEWVLDFFKEPINMIMAGLPEDRIGRVQTLFDMHYPSGYSSELGDTRFLFPIGDTLISHMNFTSATPGGAVLRLVKWMNQWRQPLGLEDPAVYIQFHGHKVSFAEEAAGWRILVEPGMGGESEGYKVNYQGKWSPGALGFCYFEQYFEDDRWLTDRSSVTLVRPRRSPR